DRTQDLLAQVVVVDLLAAGDAVLARVLGAVPLANAAAQRLGLGGAEEEALEDQLEDPPVLGRLRERRGERLTKRLGLRPRDLLQRRQRVEDLRRADRHAFAPQRVGELEYA